MEISPDTIIFWQWGPVSLNATIVFTWMIMALLVLVSWLVTRRLAVEGKLTRWQMFLETVISYIRREIREITQSDPDIYLPFIGTLFLYISVSNFLSFVPKYNPPTGSITTTAALALCVFFAVPVFGISRAGLKGYLSRYIEPSVFMLPFNIIGEFSRTLALAVRLFGNVMSGTMIVGILLSIAPLFLPVIMEALGLLIGQIQAYIFAVLATVYIASATRAYEEKKKEKMEKAEGGMNNGQH
ncbi:MAG: F0F1 ATP synthase subunit A [Candidatus Aminicenantes bacterium]